MDADLPNLTSSPSPHAVTPAHPLDVRPSKQIFQRELLSWYDSHKRELPWRRDTGPYHVWLSEIMLQQTRVAAVVDYYERFLRRFPTVQKLAAAREASVLAAWSGLGYYRRARMLHAAAKIVAGERGGVFPSAASDLQNLPGIGRYTAAAIASICFGEAVAVVDGNVERVLGRVCGKALGKEQAWTLADEMLAEERPGDFNQAMMELGAMVCVPGQPLCLACPVREICRAKGTVAGAKKASVQKKRTIHYALDCRDGSVFLVQRPHTASLMGGMWELPELSIERKPARTKTPDFVLRHSITVTDYTVRVMRRAAPEKLPGKWVPKTKAAGLPLTGLARKILRAAGII
jgi:A/G-specific adenine glycosylase